MEPLILGTQKNIGWIEVICGSMFSGKTEELLRRMRRARIAGQKVGSFKPALDTRYSDEEVVSHDENSTPSTPVHAAHQIILMAEDADVVAIDEAQFFDDDLVSVCQELARSGKRVIVAGLDQDYRAQPFEPIPQIMAVAEYVTKLHAICVKCGAPANHSQRLLEGGDRVLLGANESYEPRCRGCFEPPKEGDSSGQSEEQEDEAPPEGTASSEGDEPRAGESGSATASDEQSAKADAPSTKPSRARSPEELVE